MKWSRFFAAFLPAAVLLTPTLLAFSAGPLPGMTGGFQDQTCQVCHNSFALNQGRTEGGVFYVAGVPREYEPGRPYRLRVVIAHPGQSRFGFELSARRAGDGQQAGRLQPADENTQVKEQAGVEYIQHSARATRTRHAGGPVEYEFDWIAPDQPGEGVLFNAAGNAANFSQEPSGDYIYTASAFSGPDPGRTLVTAAGPPEPPRLNTSSRFVHLPAPRDLTRGEYEIHVEHRFRSPLVDAGFGDAFGIDSGANINLGLNYALSNRLSAGVSRARDDKIVAFSGSWELHQDPNSFWAASIHGGVEAPDNFQRHYSPFLQVPVTLDYGRLRLLAVPTMIFNTRVDADLQFLRDFMVNPDSNHTFSLGLGADLQLHRRVSLAGEYVPRLAGFGGFGADRAALSWGVKLRTWGHVFTILVSNNGTFTPSRYGVNARRNDFSLGFNIYRRR